MRLLIVEDSARLRENLAAGLRHAGYAVDLADSGPQGLWLAGTHPYDCVVLDLMLPGLDGLSVLRQLRDGGVQSHVLILTARDRVEDRVTGLRQGADDYLVKPFAFDELLARIEALVRRRHNVKAPAIRIGDLRIDTAMRTVYVAEKRIELSPREYAVLEYLAARKGQAVSRSEIEAHVYDENARLMSNVVDTVVYTLRKKLDQPGRESLIRTRRGTGYALDEGPE